MPTRPQVARLTPPGRGAIASIAVWGPECTAAIARHFQAASGRPLWAAPLGRILFGRWGGAEGEEIVLCRRAEEVIELHSHGGKAAAGAIMEALVAAGCQEADWRDWVRTHEQDPIRAAARLALPHARTERTAAILLDQLAGALTRAWTEIDEALLAGRDQAAAAQISRLLASKQLGRRLTSPWRVVLCGRPNVGKSSLANALLGYTRAIVHDQPGTTRDVVAAPTAFDGWPVELVDTAGLRDGGDEVESAGIDLARRQLGAADLAILVSDLTQDWTAAETALWAAQRCVLLVHNKCDLALPTADRPAGLAVSARTGEGIETLAAAIGPRLVPSPPQPGAAVPFLPEQVEALDQALAALQASDAAGARASIAAAHHVHH